MSRRVFLDVGGHFGETLAEAVKPQWNFDRIWAFEPATTCLPALQTFADDRTQIVNAGWWSSDTAMELHDPGSIGASVMAAKARTDATEACLFIDAACWMAENIKADDLVWMNLNCEAAEIEILERLLVTSEIEKINHLLVHFDVEKVPGMQYQAADMRVRLRAADVPFVEARQMQFGIAGHNWLHWTQASRLQRLRYAMVDRPVFRARQRLYPLKKAIARVRRPRHPETCASKTLNREEAAASSSTEVVADERMKEHDE